MLSERRENPIFGSIFFQKEAYILKRPQKKKEKQANHSFFIVITTIY